MLVTIPHDHRYWLECREEWSFFWIAFSGAEALRLHHAIIAAAGPVFRLAPSTQLVLADICVKLQSPDLTAGRASSEAYRATMALYDDVVSHADLRQRPPTRISSARSPSSAPTWRDRSTSLRFRRSRA